MTRKDYNKFADILKARRLENEASNNSPFIKIHKDFTILEVAYDMCIVFELDNSNFNRDRFIEAIQINTSNGV